MDERVPGADEWDNELHWYPKEGESIDLGDDATLEDRISAAFHEDAEIIAPPSGDAL